MDGTPLKSYHKEDLCNILRGLGFILRLTANNLLFFFEQRSDMNKFAIWGNISLVAVQKMARIEARKIHRETCNDRDNG